MRLPVLTLTVFLPIAGALLLALPIRLRRAFEVAAAILAVDLVGALTAAILYHPEAAGPQLGELSFGLGRTPPHAHLGLDGLSAPLLPIAAVIGLGVVFTAAKHVRTRRGLASILLVTGAMQLLVAALDLAWIAVGWVLWWWSATLFPRRDAGAVSGGTLLWRGTGPFLLGVGPFVVATVLCAVAGWERGLPKALDLPSLIEVGLPPTLEPFVFAGFAVAIATRMGLFPFHSWVPTLLERSGSVLAPPAFVGVKAGFVVLARVVLPLLPGAATRHASLLIAIGLLTAAYGSIVALAQRDLRRLVGFVAVSQAGPLLVGVASLERAGLAGALLHALGTGLALAGLLCVIGSIEARTGTADVESLGGLVTRAPRAAGAFLLFGLAAVGFPGTIVFVAEDLLLHGVLEHHPIVAGVLLLTTVLNAITIMRAYVRAFLGRPLRRGRLEGPHPIEDLIGRERAAVLLLLLVLFAGGVMPQPLLEMHEGAVDVLVPRPPAEAGADPGILHGG